MITLLRNKEATVAAINPISQQFPIPMNQQFPNPTNQQFSRPQNSIACQICGRFNHSAASCRNTTAITSMFSSYFSQTRQIQQYNRPPPTYRPYYYNQQTRNYRQMNYTPRFDTRYNQQPRYPLDDHHILTIFKSTSKTSKITAGHQTIIDTPFQ